MARRSRAGRKEIATVALLEPGEPARELGMRLSLVISVLKGDKMDDVVRDAVMLGVTSIRPVVSERSEIGLAAMARSTRVARWQRIAVSSAKQCGRAVVPAIHDAVPLDWYWKEKTDGARLMCVEPSAALGEVLAVQAVREAGRSRYDHWAGRRLGGVGSRRGPRFWRYPDVARRPHAARGCGADCRVDGITHDLG